MLAPPDDRLAPPELMLAPPDDRLAPPELTLAPPDDRLAPLSESPPPLAPPLARAVEPIRAIVEAEDAINIVWINLRRNISVS